MKTILIKSRDRYNGSSHNANFKLIEPIEGLYKVLSCYIPNTTFNVNSNNNSVIITDDALTPTQINFTEGNYSTTSLIAEMKAKLEASPLGGTYNITVNAITGKMNINRSDKPYEISFLNDTGYLLGFNNDRLIASNNHLGDNVINLSHPLSIGIIINQTENSTNENIITGNTSNIYIPFSFQFGSFVYISSESSYNQILKFKRTNNINIKIINTSNNQIIDLNGGDYELLLEKI